MASMLTLECETLKDGKVGFLSRCRQRVQYSCIVLNDSTTSAQQLSTTEKRCRFCFLYVKTGMSMPIVYFSVS